MSDPEYPGRMIPDAERIPLGLGWEHRRRGWRAACPFNGPEKRAEYLRGYQKFSCSDAVTNTAMLTLGVAIEEPVVDECGA